MAKILDCTLRDGGYYNEWFFSDEFVSHYLSAMHDAEVGVVELGFRYSKKRGEFGPYAYLSETTLKRILPENFSPKVAIMIEESDFRNDAGFVTQYFQECSDSKIDIVRIASHFSMVANCFNVIENLNSLGYQVCLNIMQIGNYSELEIAKLLNTIENNCELTYLYFADSLGNLSTKEIQKINKIFCENTSIPLGFHGHNNLNLALPNSLALIEMNIDIIDCTVTGMGRGAGNTITEQLLIHLNEGATTSDKLSKLIEFVDKHASSLQSQLGWGPNSYYAMAAKLGVHPTYVQTLLNSNSDFTTKELFKVIEHLGKSEGSKFSKEHLFNIINGTENKTPKNINLQKSILYSSDYIVLIGPGSVLEGEVDQIRKWILDTGARVVGCGSLSKLPDIKLDAVISSSKRLSTNLRTSLHDCSALEIFTSFDIGVDTEFAKQYFVPIVHSDNEVVITPNGVHLPSTKSLIYSLALLDLMMVKNVALVGFEGYPLSDTRNFEVLNALSKLRPKFKLFSITESLHPITRKSVYSIYD